VESLREIRGVLGVISTRLTSLLFLNVEKIVVGYGSEIGADSDSVI